MNFGNNFEIAKKIPKLKNFNCNDLINIDFFILAILGSSNSGKTTLVKYLLNELKTKFTHVILYQGSTPSEDNDYSMFIWPSNINIYTDVSKEIFANIKKEIRTDLINTTSINRYILDHNKKINDKSNNNEEILDTIRTLYIFDDFEKHTSEFSDILSQCRHSNASFIFIGHKDTNFNTNIREKITHFFISSSYNIHQIKNIFDSEVIKEYELYKKIINETLISNKSFFILLLNCSMIYFINLSNEEISNLNNITPAFHHLSIDRKKIINNLNQIAYDLKKKKIK